jgi:isoleucyl-tRNA synthetase
MRADLARREPEFLARWARDQVFLKRIEQNTEGKPFILHDGPPYANGELHHGHMLNKTLKDVVVRFQQMKGRSADYIPGWDCHGLPIELAVDKRLGKKKREMSSAEFRAECRVYAQEFIDLQMEGFKRLGVQGRWDRSYRTMTAEYEGTIAREFGRLVRSGGVVRGLRPVTWCTRCVTSVADAEVEYDDHKSPSIYVKFHSLGPISALDNLSASVVIWTTTPWTLPANRAVCLNPELTYVALRLKDDSIIVCAEGLREQMEQAIGRTGEEVARCSGAALEGVTLNHPFLDLTVPIILGDHVTTEAGTGCVHTAPGHGEDDFNVGRRYDLEVVVPVDHYGKFTDEAGPYAGLKAVPTNPMIVADLEASGHLLSDPSASVEHSYPHHSRCGRPLLFRATDQWFLSMAHDGLRERCLKAIEGVDWVPEWGQRRIHAMVAARPDWCLSRQRLWGVPIIAFHCDDCGKVNVNADWIDHVADQFDRETSDIWYVREASELLPPGASCSSCGGPTLRKDGDILDVWFDSGVSYVANGFGDAPVDLYLEGSDQHRGWFHTSLLASVATRNRAPYRAALTHGFVVDGRGHKLSKSKKNFTPADKVIEKSGAELIRLWAASADYREDIRVSDEILKRTSDSYRKLRNTLRFLLGNLAGFKPETDAVSGDQLGPLDRVILADIDAFITRVDDAFSHYQFHLAMQAVNEFCAALSAGYLDIAKDRLYCDPVDGPNRRAIQTVLMRAAEALIGVIAPVMPFTAEDAYDHLPGARAESVTLTSFPQAGRYPGSAEISAAGVTLWAVKERIATELEAFRRAKHHTYEARVTIPVSDSERAVLGVFGAGLAEFLLVGSVDFSAPDAVVSIAAVEQPGCSRCWRPDQLDARGLCARCHRALEV